MHTIRLLADSKNTSRQLRDAATRERLFWWRGSDLQFQIALADNGKFLTAIDVGTIIVEVKDLSALPETPAFMRKTYGALDCDGTFTAADWAQGSKALLTAKFTSAEAGLLPSAYRLIVRHEAPAGSGGIFHPDTPATGVLSMGATPSPGDTITIGERVITWISSGPASVDQIVISTSGILDLQRATNVGNLINFLNNSDPLVSSVNGVAPYTVALSARSGGTSGNSIALAKTGTAITVSGATMTGGVNGLPIAPKNTYCSTDIAVIEDQSESESISVPPPPPTEYYNKPETDARFATPNQIIAVDTRLTETKSRLPLMAWDYNVRIGNTAAQNDAGWLDLIAAAQTQKRNIHFDGSGDYNFSTALNIAESGIEISGENGEYTRLIQQTNAAHLFNIQLAPGGTSHGWGNQTRRISLRRLGLYGNGINISTGRALNIDGAGTITGQAFALDQVTIRGFGTGIYNRRCDQTTLTDCVIAYNNVGIDYDTSTHSLILINTGIARHGTVGIIAKAGSGNVIIGGDFGNQPRDMDIHGPQPLTIIGSNHESCITNATTGVVGTEFILLRNNCRVTVIGMNFLKGLGLDVPRFKLDGTCLLNLQGYSDDALFSADPVRQGSTASLVVGLPSFPNVSVGVKAGTATQDRYNIAPWKTITSSALLAATASVNTANDMFTVIGGAAGQPGSLIWHSPGDHKVHHLSGTLRGNGSPEGEVTADKGMLYIRNDGGASTTLYVKTSGSGNTGWTAK